MRCVQMQVRQSLKLNNHLLYSTMSILGLSHKERDKMIFIIVHCSTLFGNSLNGRWGSHLKCVPIAHVLTVGSFDSGTFCLVECFVLSRTFCLLIFWLWDILNLSMYRRFSLCTVGDFERLSTVVDYIRNTPGLTWTYRNSVDEVRSDQLNRGKSAS